MFTNLSVRTVAVFLQHARLKRGQFCTNIGFTINVTKAEENELDYQDDQQGILIFHQNAKSLGINCFIIIESLICPPWLT